MSKVVIGWGKVKVIGLRASGVMKKGEPHSDGEYDPSVIFECGAGL